MPGRHRRALEHQNIAALDGTHRIDALILRAGTPHDAGHVALFDARLVHAPEHEAGAVELVRSLRAADVLAADLGFRDGNELFDAARFRRRLRRGFRRRRFLCAGFRRRRLLDRCGLRRLRFVAVHLFLRLCIDLAALRKPVALLERFDRVHRCFAVIAGDLTGTEISELHKALLRRADLRPAHAETHRVRDRVLGIDLLHRRGAETAVAHETVRLLELLDRVDGLSVHLAITFVAAFKIAELYETLLIPDDVFVFVAGFEVIADDVARIQRVQRFRADLAVDLQVIVALERTDRRGRLFAEYAGAAALFKIAELIEAVLHLLDVVALVAFLHDVFLRLPADKQRIGGLAEHTVRKEVVMPLKCGQRFQRLISEIIGRLVKIHVAEFHQDRLNVPDQFVAVALFQHPAFQIIGRLVRIRRRFRRLRRLRCGRQGCGDRRRLLGGTLYHHRVVRKPGDRHRGLHDRGLHRFAGHGIMACPASCDRKTAADDSDDHAERQQDRSEHDQNPQQFLRHKLLKLFP